MSDAIRRADAVPGAPEDPGPLGRSERTRLRILVTSERLFAEHGLDNVSMRQIATAAHQRNHFAVQYHFGTKDALVEAILAMRRTAVNDARRPLLDALHAERDGDRAQVVRGAVSALVWPLADQLDTDENSYFLRFQDQALNPATSADGRALYPLSSTPSSETGVEAVNIIASALPELDNEARALRIGFSLRLMLRALADREQAEQETTPPTTTRARFVDELIASITAMLIHDLPPNPTRRRSAPRQPAASRSTPKPRDRAPQ